MRTRPVLLMAFAISWIAVSAFAQNNRSFVATFGNDANDCTANNECRSFTRALSVTNAGGEVLAINSGGFGPFTTFKAITVAAAPGVRASITSNSSDGIDVLAGVSDSVVLSGLTVFVDPTHNGIGAGTFGRLTVEHCNVSGGAYGVLVAGASSSFAMFTDTVFSDAAVYGAALISRVALIRCVIQNNGNAGLFIDQGTGADGIVSAVDLVSLNNAYGVFVTSGTGHAVAFDLDRGLISHNTTDGVHASATGGSAVVRVSNSTVTENNAYGFFQSGIAATFYSLGNNTVAGNSINDTVGSISPLPGT